MTISLILGAMTCGKSSELLRRAERSTYAKRKPVIVKPKIDNREYFTHNRLDVKVPVLFVDKLLEFDITPYDELYIDEGQFFDPDDLYEAVRKIAKTKKVTISALNGDSDQQPWPATQRLIPIVDEITMINGVCVDCGSEFGSFTYYTAGKKDKIVVGGIAESYICVCRDCYDKRQSNS